MRRESIPLRGGRPGREARGPYSLGKCDMPHGAKWSGTWARRLAGANAVLDAPPTTATAANP